MIMKNIIDYINEYGNETCEERPFCETDALILSRFVYFRLEKSVPGLPDNLPWVTLEKIYQNLDADYAYMHELYPELDGMLIKAMAESKRYQNMRCNYYAAQTDVEVIMQFAAMVCQMEGALPIVLFRGTDGTVVGWKEDFYMAFDRPCSGQKVAAWYLNEVAQKIDGDFIVAGHSKGGNLAVFSSMAAFGQVKDRIQTIYSFDGPGFRPEILKEYKYEEIACKVAKYMPHGSVIGIVLEGSKDYKTVRCEAVGGTFQHNPYKWIIENGLFAEVVDINVKSQIMHKSLNEWIMELDEEQFELMILNLFSILESTDEESFGNILANWKSDAAKMRKTAKNIDKDEWKNILAIIKALLEAIRTVSINSIPRIDEIRQVEEKIETEIAKGKTMVKKKAEEKAQAVVQSKNKAKEKATLKAKEAQSKKSAKPKKKPSSKAKKKAVEKTDTDGE